MKRTWLLLTAIVGMLTVPSIFVGYGMDEDAWAGARAALELVRTGTYLPSRLPGNPLFEYLLALVVPWGGFVASNLLVLASYGLLVVVFRQLAREDVESAGPAPTLLSPPATAADSSGPAPTLPSPPATATDSDGPAPTLPSPPAPDTDDTGPASALQSHPDLVTAFFALTPILLVNASSTMDYVPGLAAMLLSWWCLECGRTALAGISLGVSIGLRLTNAVFLLPLAAFVLLSRSGPGRSGLSRDRLSRDGLSRSGLSQSELSRDGIRRIVLTGAIALLIGALCYLPIFRVAGLKMLEVPPSVLSARTIALRTVYNALMLFGPLASLAIVLLVLKNLRSILRSIRTRLFSDARLALELLSLLVFTGLYAMHSDEIAYLLPVVPFFYLLMARWLPKPQLVVLSALILANAFFTFELKGGQSGRRELTFRPIWGTVVKDWLDRRELDALRTGLTRFHAAEKAVLFTGLHWMLMSENPDVVLPALEEVPRPLRSGRVLVHQLRGRPVFMAYELSREEVEQLKAEGFEVFIFTMYAPTLAINTHGYDPYEVCRPLETWTPDAFYHEHGTANPGR